ncbi:hypothetical protein AXX12_11725 [Anaerosporomusa subterranea]|uniref:Uncharacterized protein n=1 Tax=Anaerosporomusa subterranea TaxID=1794912 RepID=A0A154BQS2_ANASB|nr:hypothetical protein [Anaerosporomusa subterranea]KYZ75858.1 hypothetical protein AXX12_11725 [Anaerosporomusa subterranea]
MAFTQKFGITKQPALGCAYGCNGLLTEESAYLIAGSLDAVFHEVLKASPVLSTMDRLPLNGKVIIDQIHTEKDLAELAEQLNLLLGFAKC